MRIISSPTQPKSAPADAQPRAFGPWGRKQDGSSYDFDGEGADDERAPLLTGTVRTPRNRGYRRNQSQPYEPFYNPHETTFLSRFSGFILGIVVLLLIILGAAGFLFMSNKALYSVEISEIKNVLASEQEIMLDMLIRAVNPNVLGVSVTEMDFASDAAGFGSVTTRTFFTVPDGVPAGNTIVPREARKSVPATAVVPETT